MNYVWALASTLLVAAVTAAAWSAPALGRPTVPFGVRIPPDRVGDPAVAHVADGYRRAVLGLGAGVLAVVVLLSLVLSPDIALVSASVLLAVGHTALHARAFRALRAAKERGRWYEGKRQAVASDIGLRTDPVRLPWPWILPSALVAAGTAVAGAVLYPELPSELVVAVRYTAGETRIETAATSVWTAFSMVFAQALLSVGLPGLLRLLLRSRADIDAAAPQRSSEQYRRYLRISARCLAAAVFALNTSFAGLAALMWTGSMTDGVLAGLVLAPGVLGLLGVLGVVLAVGQSGWRLRSGVPADEATGYVQRDDDRFWHLAGTVYVNRDDPALWVPKRSMGIGQTMNLGHPAGLAIAGAALAAVAVAGTLVLVGAVPAGGVHYGWELV